MRLRLRRAHAVPVAAATLLLAATAQHPQVVPDRVLAAAPLPAAEPAPATTAQARSTPVFETAARVRLEPKPDRSSRLSAHGTDLWAISGTTSYGLPVVARRAYEAAAATTARTDPGCGLDWTVLAGIGRVESDHGRYGGAELRSDGVARPKIIGIALDGAGPVAAIRDSDGGRLDGDTTWDRAVGPMQFIPTTWAVMARDGDGDGRKNPHDIDDTALAAAAYLCAAADLTTETGRRAAVFSYNHSEYYVDLVLAFARGYATGVFDIPQPPAPEPEPTAPRKRREVPVQARPGVPAPAAPAPVRTPAPAPTKPAPTKPAPTKDGGTKDGGTKDGSTKDGSTKPPAEPEPTTLTLAPITGVWGGADGAWTVGGRLLDLGGSARAGATAAEDFDGDGTTETNALEFGGLAGATVTVQVKQGTLVVYTIKGLNYRGADGTFLS